MIRQLRTAILITLMLTILTGLVYPLSVTLMAQLLFPHQANGSLVKTKDKIIGSKLIGQNFTEAKYFHPRPSESNYDSVKSGGSNLGPTNKKLIKRINETLENLRKENSTSNIPVDLITTSASGLDPHISPEAARFQVQRIAELRKIPKQKLIQLIDENTEQKFLGIFGEPRVNVFVLNLALDEL